MLPDHGNVMPRARLSLHGCYWTIDFYISLLNMYVCMPGLFQDLSFLTLWLLHSLFCFINSIGIACKYTLFYFIKVFASSFLK